MHCGMHPSSRTLPQSYLPLLLLWDGIEPAYSSGVVALADTSLQGRFGCVLAEKLALVDKKPATCGVKANSRWKVSGFQDRKAKEWQKLETKGTPHSPLRRKSNPFMFEIIESETGTTCFHTVSCQLTALNTTGYCIPDQTGAAFGTLLQSSLKLKLARTCCPCLLSCLSCLPVFVRVCVGFISHVHASIENMAGYESGEFGINM